MPFLDQDTAQKAVLPGFVRRMALGQADACCPQPQAAPAPASAQRRARLSDLDDHVHCSIIGTCLSTGELRKLVPRHDPAIDRKSASDLAIHHAAVNLSTRNEAVAKELSKALDTRHAQAIRRFKAVADAADLATLWRAAMANGDVPGAYWALMTHPLSTIGLRSQAFGDVHMLSHLVGASNRADIRRLAALEEECAQLREQNAAQQLRLQALGVEQQRATGLAQSQALQARQLQERLAALSADDAAREREQARAALRARDEQVALLTQRCAAAEDRLAAREQALDELQSAQAAQSAELASARAEAEMLEQALAQAGEPDAAPLLPPLRGMAIAYVGGRQQSTRILARLVADAGGELLVHDGGVEDRKGLLAATLARAGLVVFPVDCVSHNAMHIAKQLAARSGTPCHPLRKASVAGFVELMRRVAGQAERPGIASLRT